MPFPKRFDFDKKPNGNDDRILRGDTFSKKFRVRNEQTGLPVNLTGAEFLMQIRDADDNILLTFDSTASPATINVSDPTDGLIELRQSAATMAAQTWASGVYDLQQLGPELDIDDNPKKRTLVTGLAVLVRDTTREVTP